MTVGSFKKDFPKHGMIWLIMFFEFLPLYMLLQISVKTNEEFIANPWFPSDPAGWQFGNILHGFHYLSPYVLNTVFTTITCTFFTIFFAILASYFFARYKMPFSDILWYIFLVLMLIPGVANMVPLFVLLKDIGLLNSLWAIIIVGSASGQVFCIFILRNFIEDLPKDLFEAAEIDGATHFQQILNVVIPLCAPIIGTLAILQFISHWNEFMLPLIIMRDSDLFTLGVGLIYLDGEYVKDWGKIMGAYLIASIPLVLLFLFTMKLFIRGLSSGAVKG